MARQAMEKSERKDYFVYVDEFQNFITPSLSQILAGARKYHLGLVLAHQEMQQLMKDDSSLASSVMGNAGTRICFRLGDSDAKRFEDGFASFNSGDLLNLGIGEAIARAGRADHDFNFSVSAPYEIEAISENKIKVIERSRSLYGCPREQVEFSLPTTAKVQGKEIGEEKETQKEQEASEAEPQTLNTPVAAEELNTLSSAQIEDTKVSLVRQKELSQHRYLQALIKRTAEGYGYKAVIEETTSDGKGRVDVSLTKGEQRIACEIGITTTKQWEIHNVIKCIDSGYDIVIAIAKDEKTVKAMGRKVDELEESYKHRVRVMDSEGLLQYLAGSVVQSQLTEKRVKGYRVKVEYGSATSKSVKDKKATIANAIISAIKAKG